MTYDPPRLWEGAHLILSIGHPWAAASQLHKPMPTTAAAWPAADRALYMPFIVPVHGLTAYKMFTGNGSAATGNADLGIYDSAGGRLVSTGPTAMTVTSNLQLFDITDTPLPMGLYYMALTASVASSSMTFLRHNVAGVGAGNLVGIRQEASISTLPSTAAFAEMATNYYPLFGIQVRTTDA